jgi:septal ring factor EnvC (AmiA/AmiB activator)
MSAADPIRTVMADVILDSQKEIEDLKASLAQAQQTLDTERAARAAAEAALSSEKVMRAELKGRLDAILAAQATMPIVAPQPALDAGFDISVRRSDRGTLMGLKVRKAPNG